MKIVLFFILCAILMFPLWLMVVNSFTPAMNFLRMPPRIVPYDFTLEHYKNILHLKYLPQWLLNSAIIMVCMVVGGVIINGSAGYVFAFAKGLDPVFWAMIAPVFVVRIVVIIAQFIVVGQLGLRGLPAVILMVLFWPTGIFIFKNYFQSIPVSMMESARIDGASEWTILMRIVLPLAKPVLGAAVIFLGMWALGDYIWQMLNLQTEPQRTFLTGLLQTTIDIYVVKNIGYALAVGTMLFIPYLALFAFSGKYFIKGLNMGGVKE